METKPKSWSPWGPPWSSMHFLKIHLPIRRILRGLGATPSTILLLEAMVSYLQLGSTQMFRGVRALADDAGISKSAAEDSLNWAREKGLVLVIKKGAGGMSASVYDLAGLIAAVKPLSAGEDSGQALLSAGEDSPTFRSGQSDLPERTDLSAREDSLDKNQKTVRHQPTVGSQDIPTAVIDSEVSSKAVEDRSSNNRPPLSTLAQAYAVQPTSRVSPAPLEKTLSPQEISAALVVETLMADWHNEFKGSYADNLRILDGKCWGGAELNQLLSTFGRASRTYPRMSLPRFLERENWRGLLPRRTSALPGSQHQTETYLYDFDD